MSGGLRFAALGFTALLAACTSGPLEGGRYACVFGGPADDCPEDWRCGFEGYCHQAGDTSVAWRCEGDQHCEKGFSCGLEPGRDGGQCHDPAVAAAHACLEERHCTAGWHCGPSGRCYDRTVPAEHLCRFDAGDCADSWRCGLEGRCQNQDAGAPYLCRTDAGLEDSWCEQGWRCAPEGRCVDPVRDALASAPLPLGATQALNPLGTRGPIERFAVSQLYSSGGGIGRQTVAFVQNGQLNARIIDQRAGAGSSAYSLGPWSGAAALAALGSRGQAEVTPDVQDQLSRLFVANRDAGVEVITLGPDGGAVREWVDTIYPASRLTVGTAQEPWSPRVLAFTGVPDRFHRLVGGASLDAVLDNDIYESGLQVRFDEQDPTNRLIDLVAVRPSRCMDCVFAVDRRGLWVSQRHEPNLAVDSFGFEPIELPWLSNDRCRPPVAETQRITRLAPHGRDWLGISTTGMDGGSPQVAILDLRPLWSRGYANSVCVSYLGEPCTLADRLPVDSHMGPCPVCTGGQLLDFSVVLDPVGQPRAEVRCGGDDGGTTGFSVLTRRANGQCSNLRAQGESGVFTRASLLAPEHQVAGQVAWASNDGFIWTGSSIQTITSELLDRAPTTAARRGPAPAGLLAFTPELTASFVAGVGLAARPETGVLSPVANSPEWVVNDQRQVIDLTRPVSSDASLVALIGNLVNSFDPPYLASTAQSGAAKVLVVSAGANLFSAELEPSLPYSSPSLKAVSPSQLTSLAFAPQAPAGIYLQGYAVTPNGVLRLTAQTSSRWLFEPVSLPAALLPQEVWFEAERARVGFTDGTVYALPSRVPLAPALSDGVVDYAQACGQQLALGPSGLFRLEPQPGSSVGAWKELLLVPGFATAGAFTGGRIHGVGGAVYVFKRGGEAAQLEFSGCPSP